MATKAELEGQVAGLCKELEEMRDAIRNIMQKSNNLEDRLMAVDAKLLDQEVTIAKLKAAPVAKPVAAKPQPGVMHY